MSATFPTAVPPFRSRIGRDARSGYYAASRRYRLHLVLSCPHSVQIAVVHGLLGLDDTVPVTLLPAVPDAPGGGHRALRPLYEASAHQHPGPAAAPVLSDGWTGRIVSTHAPDILRDLARRFGGDGPALLPRGAEEAVEDVARLCEQGITAAAQRAGQWDGDPAARATALATLLDALDALEGRLDGREHLLGDGPTLADVQAWAALLHLDTVHRHHLDAEAVHRITGHPRLWAYARRLAAHPAFGSRIDLDGIARRHHAHCRGREAAGAAVPIVDWTAYA
ncbi:glutathione S-transferase C-terminal domain-containing protein [Streptomyces dubilierae]|uniref:Glutathione S-transferase C-terminal domain-containing protein n=1 Tax=Streptomyces dubilierae TaxID=3075533 RepID=A0ABU2PE83_9ACTN|nr:glutathione S-transferase C-terminal domain-containing protein [Streptomyces sp. DSM 41921]MDT0390166.1 glutathione S-transferase C-terminal domain-containing protein [Streptomyces sp. DSM 41921]